MVQTAEGQSCLEVSKLLPGTKCGVRGEAVSGRRGRGLSQAGAEETRGQTLKAQEAGWIDRLRGSWLLK